MLLLEEELSKTYMDLVNTIIKSKVLSKKKIFIDNLLRILYKNFGKWIKIRGIYNILSQSFNRTYFYKNLLKNVISFYYLRDHDFFIDYEITDIGCGAAPSAIAYYYLRNQYEGFSQTKATANIVDCSEHQLRIASVLLSFFNIETRKSNCNYKIDGTSCYAHKVFFSYFMCEQNKNFIKGLMKYHSNFSKGFVLIDYKSNIKKLEKRLLANETGEFISWDLTYQLDEEIAELIGEDNINVCGGYFKPY
jgi:hypothetical protein